ncbi:MAG: hypothetical protein DME50_05600 [Verrucomicrobia bacterium]|nr:MAG: hypothetical protein DME50_05600 [Verrucomicrobiota bacterium]
MKILKHKPLRLLFAAIAFGVIASLGHAANLSDQDKKFLTSYEKIHVALAADDLAGVKAAATELGDSESDIAKANSLRNARAAFEKLSAHAKTITAGQNGYHVAHCPMLNKDWVQTSTTISNPYGGKEMIGCGEIQKSYD